MRIPAITPLSLLLLLLCTIVTIEAYEQGEENDEAYDAIPKEDFSANARRIEEEVPPRWQHSIKITVTVPPEEADGTGECHIALNSESSRALVRGFLSEREISQLHRIATQGIGEIGKDSDGPTIFDPDLGLILAPGGQLHRSQADASREELEMYGEVMRRIKHNVARIHGVDPALLYHTAPTFIARLRKPASEENHHVHDEYYHVHADKNNTAHYDYSAIVYLSTHGEEFTGGVFEFVPFSPSLEEAEERGDRVLVHRPRKGDFLTFHSGANNPHRVTRVETGERFALSTWWTCDPSKRLTRSRVLMMKTTADETKLRDEV